METFRNSTYQYKYYSKKQLNERKYLQLHYNDYIFCDQFFYLSTETNVILTMPDESTQIHNLHISNHITLYTYI